VLITGESSCRPVEVDHVLAAALECHRLAYAELLHRWGLIQCRTQVLGLLHASYDRKEGVALDRVKIESGVPPVSTSLGIYFRLLKCLPAMTC
jgi:hypothetical protein